MMQDDDINTSCQSVAPDCSYNSNLMPIQVDLQTSTPLPPQRHPLWTSQTMKKSFSDETPNSSFPGSSAQDGFKTERPDGTMTDSSKSPHQNAFQFSHGFNSAPVFPSGMPPLAYASIVPVQGYPNSLPASVFPGGMSILGQDVPLAIANNSLAWRMLMEGYARMARHRNELLTAHLNRQQIQTSAEYSGQFTAPDQRAGAQNSPSRLQETQQQLRTNVSPMNNFRHQMQGLDCSNRLTSNTPGLSGNSSSRRKALRGRKRERKFSQTPPGDESQTLNRQFSVESSIANLPGFSLPYAHFAYSNAPSAPHSATASNPGTTAVDIDSEPVMADVSKISRKENVTQLENKSHGLQSHEKLPDHLKDMTRMVMSYSDADQRETRRQDQPSEVQCHEPESISRSSTQKMLPEVAVKQEMSTEPPFIFPSGFGMDVSDLDNDPWPDKQPQNPADENPDANGGIGFISFNALSQSTRRAATCPRKKVLRCRMCPFVASEKRAFYEHKFVHFSRKKLMICTECEFVTHLKHHFQYHVNTHRGNRPFPCSLCDYRGTNLAMLKSHLKTHKKYSCADCVYSATSSDSLQIHLNAENHRAAPVPSIIRARSRVVRPADKKKIQNSRRLGGLKTCEKYELNRSQSREMSASATSSTGDPNGTFDSTSNAFHLSQSLSPQVNPQKHLASLTVSRSSIVWPGSLNPSQNLHWPAAFSVATTPGQLAPSFALPQPLPFSAQSTEKSTSTCKFCSFSTSNKSDLMRHVSIQHRMLLSSFIQGRKLPSDGSMFHNKKSTMPGTVGNSTRGSSSLNSDANTAWPSLLHFSGNSCATAGAVVVTVAELESNVSEEGQEHPVLPLDLSCIQEQCQKPSRRKGVARKLAMEQIDDEDVYEYFSNFLPVPTELFDRSVMSSVQCISASVEPPATQSDTKLETESKDFIHPGQSVEQLDSLQRNSRSSLQKLLSRPCNKSKLVSEKNCVDIKQGQEPKDTKSDTVNETTAASKQTTSKTYKCHHCGIIFLDYILYSMHSGYHNFDDPLRCNICGRRSNDILEFYTHIGKYAHPES